ncbi:thioredoxin family protein [Soonwooa sp.]|uniref:TlpA family protein disulfide reductase n=1 Tax=Soonwooa sp. TaxID=1938592 RepID=UPI002630C030|nr:thioredoxin family protein [Soonwooa sp.]
MIKSISKLMLFGVLALSMQSCFAQKVVVNREVDTQSDGKMLLGEQTLEQFKKEPFSDWYDKEYNDYKIDEESLKALKKEKVSGYSYIVFLGTWCGDSHREFPRFMKIMDAAGVNHNKIQIITVNRKKESPNGEEGLFNIQRVPTFIVKKYGNEVGRIIEYPESGFLEKDLLNILKKKGQTKLAPEVNEKY